jgi:hypothetical protein
MMDLLLSPLESHVIWRAHNSVQGSSCHSESEPFNIFSRLPELHILPNSGIWLLEWLLPFNPYLAHCSLKRILNGAVVLCLSSISSHAAYPLWDGGHSPWWSSNTDIILMCRGLEKPSNIRNSLLGHQAEPGDATGVPS